MAQDNTSVVRTAFELHPLENLWSLVNQAYMQRAIWTFCELGVADLMTMYKVPVTAVELSRVNGNNWNAEHLYRLLRLMTHADIIKRSESNYENLSESDHPEQTDKFELTDNGFYLTSNHVSRMRDMIRYVMDPHATNAYSYCPSIIKNECKSGNGFEQAYGCSIVDYMKSEKNEEYRTIFNNAMVAFSHFEIPWFISTIDLTTFNQLVDIGGGLGTFLSGILEKFQNLHGVLFDLPQVIENSKSIIPNEFERRFIEPSRYDFAAGDVFESKTVPAGDAYILKYIVHGWNDEQAIEILKSIRNANKNHVGKTITVFIVESIMISHSKESLDIHVLDLEMLVMAGSKVRTLTEHKQLLLVSGYAFKKLYSSPDVISVIEAVTTVEHSDKETKYLED